MSACEEDKDHKPEEKSEQIESHPDIDGGWGWMICLASFMAHVLLMGSHMALGILYVEWLEEFNESRGLTAWVGSLTIGITLIVGPIIGLFVGTCGCRKTTIIGGLLTALGWVISAYATNVYYLFISFGLTAGHWLHIKMVFEDGAAVTFRDTKTSWGLIRGIGSGMAYLPAIVMVGQYFKKRRALAQGLSTTGTGFGTFIMTLLLKYLCTEYGWRNAMLIHGAVNLNLCVCGALMRPPPSSSSIQIENQSQPECAETLQKEIPTSDQVAHAIDIDGIEEHETSKEEETKSLSLEEVSELQEAENKGRAKREVIFKERYPLRILKTLSQLANILKKSFWKWYSSYFGTAALFSNKVFICFVFWALCAYCSFVIPFIHLPEIVKLYGFEEKDDKVPLTSIIAILHIFGKIFLGLISDLPFINAWNVFLVANLIMCICVFILPLMHTFTGMATVCAIIGFSSGYFSVMPVVTEDLVGLSNLANAYGIIISANGISALLGPPFAGWIYDVTGKYDYSFYFCGLIYVIGIGFLLLKPCLQKQNDTENKSKQATEALHVHHNE